MGRRENSITQISYRDSGRTGSEAHNGGWSNVDVRPRGRLEAQGTPAEAGRGAAAKNNKVMLMRRSSYRDTGATTHTGKSDDAGTSQVTMARRYDALAAAMSRNLEALSRDIAAVVRELKGT